MKPTRTSPPRFAAALVSSEAARQQLESALPPTLPVRISDSIATFRDLALRAGAAIAFATPTDRCGNVTWPLLTRVQADFPSLPLVGIVATRDAFVTHVADLVRVGVVDVVQLDAADAVPCLTAACAKARDMTCVEWALGQLGPAVSADLAPLVTHCLAHAAHRITARELWVLSGWRRRDGVSWRRQPGAPSLMNLASWCRVLVATKLLEDRGRPVHAIAMELGFPSSDALSALLRRYVGLSAREVRVAGGVACVVAPMKQALRATQAQTRPLGTVSWRPMLHRHPTVSGRG